MLDLNVGHINLPRRCSTKIYSSCLVRYKPWYDKLTANPTILTCQSLHCWTTSYLAIYSQLFLMMSCECNPSDHVLKGYFHSDKQRLMSWEYLKASLGRWLFSVSCPNLPSWFKGGGRPPLCTRLFGFKSFDLWRNNNLFLPISLQCN